VATAGLVNVIGILPAFSSVVPITLPTGRYALFASAAFTMTGARDSTIHTPTALCNFTLGPGVSGAAAGVLLSPGNILSSSGGSSVEFARASLSHQIVVNVTAATGTVTLQCTIFDPVTQVSVQNSTLTAIEVAP
jgi:hypothetical protein